MNTQGKIKIQVWLMIFLVFVLGGVTGASVDHLYKAKYGINRTASPNNNPRRQRMVEGMRKDLNLSEAQVNQVRTIYEETRKEFHNRSIQECPVFKEMRVRTRERIRAILTPDQQIKYNEINAKRDAEKSQKKS